MQTYRYISQLLVTIRNTLKELLKTLYFCTKYLPFYNCFPFYPFFFFCHFTNIVHETKENNNGTNNSQGYLSDLILPSGREFVFSCGFKKLLNICVYIYIYFLMYHFLRGVNHLKYLEMSLQILPVQVKPEHTCVSQVGSVFSESISNQHSCCVSARLRGSGQLRMCFYFILVESGVVERHLLEKAEHLNLAIQKALMFEYTWYQTHQS